MSLIKNMLLFCLVFLPLTYVVALPGELYQGRFASAVEGSQFYNWIGVAVPLVLPGLGFILLFHLVFWLVFSNYEISDGRLRKLCLMVFPLGFLLSHLCVWGTDLVSWQLLVTILLPGLAFGALARWPKSTAMPA